MSREFASTLAKWVGRTGVALQPLADRLILHSLQGRALSADETPVAQLDPGAKMRRADLWGVSQARLRNRAAYHRIHAKPAVAANMRVIFLDGWQGHLRCHDQPVINRCSPSPATAPESLSVHAPVFRPHQANASTIAFESIKRIGKLQRSLPKTRKAFNHRNPADTACRKKLPLGSCWHHWLPRNRLHTPTAAAPLKRSTTP